MEKRKNEKTEKRKNERAKKRKENKENYLIKII